MAEWTEEEKAAERQRAADRAAAAADPNGNVMDRQKAQRSSNLVASVAINQNRMQAAADAADLASLPRQEGKAAQAPGRRAAPGGTVGGPTTLLTGGTAADALSVKRTRAGLPSLLGG